jgi:hypothetical protein
VYSAAPRLDPRLLEAIARIDDHSVPIAETYRRTRDVAEDLDIPRPSYERVRLHLKLVRRRRMVRRRKRDILIDVAMHLRPVEDLYEVLEEHGDAASYKL